MIVFGLDMGFVKTGIAVLELQKKNDVLVYASALKSELVDLQYKSLEDLSRIDSTLSQLDELVREYEPEAVFVEVPSGGSKSSRASTCMAMTKAMVGCFVHYNDLAYEYMIPSEVEKLIGIKLDPNDAKGMKSADKQKWKKERSRDVVLAAFPGFDGWPHAAYLAEDAYDAAAAFLAGRNKNELYMRLKAKLFKGEA